ncbi:hypothetical protein [Pseudomonas sp. LRF_L74]|uniref:hypothetical protein n=1 Tax=Pseudomonas sp. LRF_L74 TaxID=3369422 RepID=UPI003F5E6F7D
MISSVTEKWPLPAHETLALIHPQWIVECFLPAKLSTDEVQVLLQQSRFHERLLGALQQHHGLDALDGLRRAEPAAAAFFMASRERREGLARACGAVAHAASFTHALQAAQVRALRERFAAGNVELAVRHRALALDRAPIDDPLVLQAAIDRDGVACIDAWLQALPASVAGWLRLRGEPTSVAAAPNEDMSQGGPRIVRALAVDVLTPEEQA